MTERENETHVSDCKVDFLTAMYNTTSSSSFRTQSYSWGLWEHQLTRIHHCAGSIYTANILNRINLVLS